MKVVAVVPAKGSSDRLPNKNTMLLDGEPLFLRALKNLARTPAIDEVWLDTESDEIAALAVEVACEVLRRDPALATNRTDGNALLLNEVAHVEADVYVQALCTSPFLRPATIERAVRAVLDHPERWDSAVAVVREKQYPWRDGRPAYPLDRIPNSVDLPDTVRESMGLYVITREAALRTGRRIGEHPCAIELEPLEAIDVNHPEDFELARLVAIGLREQERRLFHNLRAQLSTALISDILDDLGVEGMLSPEFQLNLPDTKVLGRAKTMQIERCESDGDYRRIYDGLGLYDHVVSNDVIVVANRVPRYAFFGELNAHLAIRSGAVGALIDGATRDSAATTRLGFPVFSKGTWAQDTKKRGIVTARNRPVVIDGVTIRKDDLVFGDRDGVVVIPRRLEETVIARALEALEQETRITLDVARGVHARELVTRYGFF